MATLYTIGHSNHSIEKFLELLKAHKIIQVIDVRSIPKSRWVPWFDKDALNASLKQLKISYCHMPILGGRRSTSRKSINTGWQNASFRGYADYMQTITFYQGLKELNKKIKGIKSAIMCAEAVPWRCHRSLIGDAELVRGIKVMNIMNKHTAKEHKLTSFAVVDRNKKPIKLYYPA